MGSFLSEIEGKQIKVDTELLNASHSKLVQYYSSYKSICEGYTINIPEYTHIFGPNQLSFEVWDPKARGKIDAIQMFTGLIVFSALGFEQKVKFLFQVFDFNEEGVLYYQNIALLLINVCNATFKILQIRGTIQTSAIQAFLDQYFIEESKIGFQRLLRWTAKVEQVSKYFKAIDHQIDQKEEEKHIVWLDNQEQTAAVSSKDTSAKVYFSNQPVEIDISFFSRLEPLFIRKTVPEQFNFCPQWVFGINANPLSLRYLSMPCSKAASQLIVSSVGKLIIVFYPKLNLQKIYKEHHASISVIEIADSQRIVASGEDTLYPQIHLWELQSKKTLARFKRLHKDKISMLRFFRKDRHLITASEDVGRNGKETPFIVLNLDTQEIVVSTYLSYQIKGVIFADWLQSAQFLIVSPWQVGFFEQLKDSYQIYSQKTDLAEPILAIALNKQTGCLVTSHSGRRLYRWSNKMIPTPILFVSLYDEEEILELVWIGEQQLILMDCRDIEVLRFEGEAVLRVYALRLMETRLINKGLCHVEPIGNDAIVVFGVMGDVVKVSPLDHLQRPQYHKHYQFFRLASPTAYSELSPSTAIVASQNLLYSIDLYQHELCQLSSLPFNILGVATSLKQNLILLCENAQENYNILYSLNVSDFKVIENIKVSSKSTCHMLLQDNTLMVFVEGAVQVFQKGSQHNFFDRKPVVSQFSFSCPVSVCPTATKQQFILYDDKHELLKLILGSHGQVQFRKIDKQSLSPMFTSISSIYRSEGKSYPYAGDLNRRLFMVGDNDGDLLLWQSLAELEKDAATRIKYYAGRVTGIIIEDSRVVTWAKEDGMLTLFAHSSYSEPIESQPFVEEHSLEENHSDLAESFGRSRDIHHSYHQSELSVPQSPYRQDKNSSFATKTSQSKTNMHSFLKQSQVELSPLQEAENSQLKQLIKEIVNPRDKMVYEAQLKDKEGTEVTIEVEQVHGLAAKTMGGLLYRHYYNQQPQPLIPVERSEKVQKGYMNEQLQFSKGLLLALDNSHLSCTRSILTYSDRYCVIQPLDSSSSEPKKQTLFGNHRSRVTCIGLHPDKMMVVSCEEEGPMMTWWGADGVLYGSRKARHQGPIQRVVFSRDGKWIASLGGLRGSMSVQLTSWKDNTQLTFRSIGEESINDIQFNPYDRNELSVAGVNLIQVYHYKANLLSLTDSASTGGQFTCLVYTSSLYGNSIESDLILGNSSGDIGIFICGKYILSKERAHSRPIVSMRIAQLFGYKKVLLTGGEDGCVRIWDHKFNQLAKKDIAEQLYGFKLDNERPECSITSIDIYQCYKATGVDCPPTLVLLGVSDGSVMEATIHNEFQGYQKRSLATQEVQLLKEKINFDLSLVKTGPPSVIPTRFQLYKDIMVTYSPVSKCVQFWSLSTSERLLSYSFNEQPSYAVFLGHRPCLVVAFKNVAVNYISLYELQFQSHLNLLKTLRLKTEIPLVKGHGEILKVTIDDKDTHLVVQCIANEGSSTTGHVLYLFQASHSQNEGLTFSFRGKIQLTNLQVGYLQFNCTGQALLVAWLDFRKNSQMEFQLKSYNSQSLDELPVGKFDFRRLDFSRKVKAAYLGCPSLSRSEVIGKALSLKVTVMAQYDRYLLLGTVNGEVLVIEASFFLRKASESKVLVRNFMICCSSIRWLQVRQDMLYVGSEEGQSVIRAKISLQESWKLPEPTSRVAVDSPEQIDRKVKQVYAKRKRLSAQEDLGVDQGHKWLRLLRVVGRRALNRRNNIFVDLKDNIICCSGCNVLIGRYGGRQLSQRVLKPDPSPHSAHPEISTLFLSQNKHMLLIGTAEQTTNLLVWNISTNTYLFSMALPGFITILLIKLSHSNRKAAVQVLSAKGLRYLLYIDVVEQQVLAVYRLEGIMLNDICFKHNQDQVLLGCGPNYMGEWTYGNGILTPSRYSLGHNLQDLEQSGIVFYSLISLEDMDISSASDGYLYVWRHKALAKRQNAHPGHQVLSLYAGVGSKVFASGGTNGRVVIWKVWSSLIIQHQGEYPKQGSLKFAVQSISMTGDSLIVGDTSGAIHQFAFGQEEPYGPPNPVLMSPFDHQTINSCAFSTASKRLYVLTTSGLYGTFAIFDTSTFQKLREERLQFKSELIKMLVCKLTNKIFLVLKHAINEYIVVGEGAKESKESREGKLLKFKSSKAEPSGIKTAALSARENYLAVLVAQSSVNNSKIDIFTLPASSDNKGEFFEDCRTRDNIPANIDLLDFCADHDYLLFQGQDEEQTIIDLMSWEKVKASEVQSQLQWLGEGKKTSAALADIISGSYSSSQENKLLRVVQIKNSCLVATDEMGSLRVFVDKQLRQICVEHLNQVYICVVSHDNRMLVTVGKHDRALHFWEFIPPPVHP